MVVCSSDDQLSGCPKTTANEEIIKKSHNTMLKNWLWVLYLLKGWSETHLIKKRAFLFSSWQCTCAHTSLIAVVKLHELLPHAPHVLTRLALSSYFFCSKFQTNGSLEKGSVRCHHWHKHLFWRDRETLLDWRYKEVRILLV